MKPSAPWTRCSPGKTTRTEVLVTSNAELPRWMTQAVVAAMEQAAISGLCLEGQLEIGAQTVRELDPGIGAGEALALATAIDKSHRSSD